MSQTPSALQRLLHFTLTHRSEVGATVTDFAGEETEAWRGALTSLMALETCGKSMELNSSNWTPGPGPTAYLGGNQWILTMCLLRSLRVPSVLCASSLMAAELRSWGATWCPRSRGRTEASTVSETHLCQGSKQALLLLLWGPRSPAPAPWILVLRHRLNGLLICLSGNLLEKIKISFIFLVLFFFWKNKTMTLSCHLFSFSKKCTSFGLQEEKSCWVIGLLKTLTLKKKWGIVAL